MDENLPLSTFQPIALEVVKEIRLMSRVDIKYVIDAARLPALMEMLAHDYYIQENAGSKSRSFDYHTLYFDTQGYNMYHTHQNGKLDRYKIRTREYCDTHQAFLEVKHKSNKGVTRKTRIEHKGLTEIDQSASQHFIHSHSPYFTSTLEAKLESEYRRITLVDKQQTERLTIDYHLTFRNVCTGKKVELPNLVIIEVKMSNYRSSLVREKMQHMHIKPCRVSKYCLGTGLTDATVKQNILKRKIMSINKITDFVYD